MLGEIPVISPLFQALLDGIGWILAAIYDVIPNFGISIIILTILIRVVLLPLGIKQIKSMQAMQAIQPKVKELQKKYKGNKEKAQQETMKIYREHGVNPLGGCLPLLLQFPLLVAMYAVVRPPSLLPVNIDENGRAVPVVLADGQDRAAYVAQIDGYEIHNNHLPVDSELFKNVVTHQDLDFLWLNLQCSAAQAGTAAPIVDTGRQTVEAGKPLLSSTGGPVSFDPASVAKLDCGNSVAQKVPYFLFLATMIATTFFQQRQMQRASPPGASSSQQQLLLKIMPVMFGIFGFTFPSGLVVYWTTANFWQIGQQAILMKAGHIGPDALERRKRELADRPPKEKKGLMAGLMERAEQEKQRRAPAKPETGRKPPPRKNPPSGRRKPSSGSRPTGGRKPPPGRKKPGGSSGSSNGKDRPNG